jgi:hypothetical protein
MAEPIVNGVAREVRRVIERVRAMPDFCPIVARIGLPWRS